MHEQSLEWEFSFLNNCLNSFPYAAVKLMAKRNISKPILFEE
jgi:hypothetical protein